MTKPITREEFAELAVKLYEKVTGKAAVANSTNPFTDTKNPEILKAYQLGITQGTSATTFTPAELTNREQVATMLSRAIKVMVPGADFSTQGSPTFTDQSQISSWAVEHVKFMSKAGIIKGTASCRLCKHYP
ncbi:MAG TPA: S-layer homology domain-containing protein [Negativicutes bacterium]|nr:S-layer homology domain-containing protein [Negativicutes bacterium]